MAFGNRLLLDDCRLEKLVIKLLSLLSLFEQLPRYSALSSGEVWRYLGSLLDGLAFWIESHHWYQAAISQRAKADWEIEGGGRTMLASEKSIESGIFSMILTLEVEKTRVESAARLSLICRIDSWATASHLDDLGLSCAPLVAGFSEKFLRERYQIKEPARNDAIIFDKIGGFVTEEQEYGYVEDPIPDIEFDSADSGFWEWNPDQAVFQHWDEELEQMIICPETLD